MNQKTNEAGKVTGKAEVMELAVETLRAGDRVDLKSCPFLRKHPTACFEYAVVESVERETPDCVAVTYEDLDMIGYSVGTRLKVSPETYASRALPQRSDGTILRCSFCEEHAVAEMPSSSDLGKTVRMVRCCTGHRSGWWDGADWDGRHLEVDLLEAGKMSELTESEPLVTRVTQFDINFNALSRGLQTTTIATMPDGCRSVEVTRYLQDGRYCRALVQWQESDPLNFQVDVGIFGHTIAHSLPSQLIGDGTLEYSNLMVAFNGIHARMNTLLSALDAAAREMPEVVWEDDHGRWVGKVNGVAVGHVAQHESRPRGDEYPFMVRLADSRSVNGQKFAFVDDVASVEDGKARLLQMVKSAIEGKIPSDVLAVVSGELRANEYRADDERESISDRLVVTVDQADGHNVLTALAPAGMSDDEACDVVRACASANTEHSGLMQELNQRGFVVFRRFAKVDIE